MPGQAYYNNVNDFCDRLRQGRVPGSLAAAKGTAELMRQLVTASRLNDPHTMLEKVRSVGIQIQTAKPIELVTGNIVRRVMHIIREEMQDEPEEEVAMDTAADSDLHPVTGGLSRALGRPPNTVRNWGRTFSLHNLLDQMPDDDADPFGTGSSSTTTTTTTTSQQAPSPQEAQRGKPAAAAVPSAPWDRKQEVIDGVNDLIDELKDIDSAIAAHAQEHIHSNETVLTFGSSRTVAQFLCRAREKRSFQAVVAEGAPTLQGHAMAAELAAAGIRTTAIADAAVYAIMARVNKVVVSAHALLADGGVMAPVGTAMVAAAAKRHSVPFVVLVGIYKLSPLFPHEPGVTFNDFKEPSDVLPYSDEAVLAAEIAEASASERATVGPGSGDIGTPFLQVHNPSYDYIPPDHISLFLTDHGHGFMPSYVYRQLSEFYHRQDYELSKELDAALFR